MVNWLVTHTPLFYLTQSLWRDEAFSVLIAEYGITDIVRLTAADYSPPLYYFLLHYWMMIAGNGEIAVRVLSFLFFIALLVIIYVFARDVLKLRRNDRIAVTVLMAVNPMLLYYAFEARAYMLAVLLVSTAMYAFMQKRWWLFRITSLVALYTHPYTVFVLFAPVIYSVLQKDFKLLKQVVRSSLIIMAGYLPWLFVIVKQILESGSMWFYPVDRNLAEAVAGNLYLGFEGNPPWFWLLSKYITLVIFALITLGLLNSSSRNKKWFLFVWFLFPIALTVGISFIKPIFVARYVLYSTVALVLLVGLGIMAIKNSTVKWGVFCMVLTATVWFNSWYAPYHAKVDFRRTLSGIETQFQKGDIIQAASALAYFETVYYAPDRGAVYLQRSDQSPLPRYVGSVLIPRERWLAEPSAGVNMFTVFEDGSYTKQ